MRAPDISSVAEHADQTESLSSALPVGLVIGGKYEIKRVLGMGGNGAVYEGEHNVVGHRVAIKVVHQALANQEDILVRFRREARLCGSLRHPNVGQVYDVGTLDDGAPYMVMELQEGRSFGDVLDETELPIPAVIDITRQLLAGLGAAHQSGVVHRDVKPDNVMIVRDHSGEIVVKLVDFGISKSTDPRHAERSAIEKGSIIGSPDYMPPELLHGGEANICSDLYAVGILLYEAITNRMPFSGHSLTDLFTSILRAPIKRPTTLRADCSVELEHIVLKAISRDPAKRYQTADEMSRELAKARATTTPATNLARFSERPPQGTKPTNTTRTHRRRTVDSHTLEEIRLQTGAAIPGKRSPYAAIAVGAGVLALAGLAWVATSPKAATNRVVVTQLPSAAPIVAPAPQLALAPAVQPVAPVIEEPIVAPAQEPKRSTEPAGGARSPIGKAPVRSRQLAARSPEQDPQAMQAQLKQAATAFALGQTAQARSLYKQIVKMSPREADAWRGLGVVSSQLGETSEAVQAFQRYLALRPGAADAARVRGQLEKLQGGSR